MMDTLKTFGSKTRFALSYRLLPDPDEGGSPALRASWGMLEIWVEGRNLTSAIIMGEDTLVQSAEVPLFPIVEWFINNWDTCFHEERLPQPGRFTSAAEWYVQSLLNLPMNAGERDRVLSLRRRWKSEHSLKSSLPGFQLPDIHIRRLDGSIELSWYPQDDPSVPKGIRLVEAPGVSYLSIPDVVGPVLDWCHSLLAALSEVKEASSDVERLLGALSDLRDPSRTPKRIALEAGVNLEALKAWMDTRTHGISTSNLWSSIDGAIQESQGTLVARTLPFPLLAFKTTSPKLLPDDAERLVQLVEEVLHGDATDFHWREQIAPATEPKWSTQQGYELAVELREKLDIPLDVPLCGDYDLERVLIPNLGITLRDVAFMDRAIEGVSLWRPGSKPLICVNPGGRFTGTPWGRRMTIAHELCHVMHDGSSSGLGIVSNPWAPYLYERRANAFSVMFLASDEALLRILGGDSAMWTAGDLREAMTQLGIGSSTLCHHLANRGFIGNAQRDAFLEELTT